MSPNLSLVCVLGALAGTSGQGTNSTTLSTSCTCTVDTTSVAELAARPVPTAPREETRFLFLLGYPHTGTSAMYFLLSTSASVTGIEGDNDVRLGPTKEGMAHFENGRPYGRWEADFPQIWEAQYATQAETLYLEKALPGKLFVENSPPEIYLPHQLNATFSKHGKVRFILLVHGMCGKDLCAFTGYCRGLEQRMNITLDKHNRGVAPWAMALHNYNKIITDFGEDVHVIRYEDICLRWGRVLRDLAAWEPRLGDINISRSPPIHHTKAHSTNSTTLGHHEASSVSDYCDLARPSWREPKPAICTAAPPTFPNIGSSCASMAARLGYFYHPGQFDCNSQS